MRWDNPHLLHDLWVVQHQIQLRAVLQELAQASDRTVTKRNVRDCGVGDENGDMVTYMPI